MAINWLVQENLVSTNTRQLASALTLQGQRWDPVQVEPDAPASAQEFAPFLAGSSRSAKITIPYGSTRFVQHCYDLGLRQHTGLHYDPQLFSARTLCINHSRALNHEAHFTTVENLPFSGNVGRRAVGNEVFLKPNHDLKAFSGRVLTLDELHDHGLELGPRVCSDTEVMIATPQDLWMEMRFFVIGGRVVDGSWYRFNGKPHSQHISRTEINLALYEGAQSLVDEWCPMPNAVMDMALVPTPGPAKAHDLGQYRVVEYNCIHCSGFYKHMVSDIVASWATYYAR